MIAAVSTGLVYVLLVGTLAVCGWYGVADLRRWWADARRPAPRASVGSHVRVVPRPYDWAAEPPDDVAPRG